jgi:fimbrial isopeptide formation D2 family protein/LPXTG-motif cell wall-anchored protein
MKKFTKLLGIVLIMALVMSMGAIALAAEGDVTNTPVNTGSFTITITKDTTDKAAHTYGAYQIFKGDLAETEGADGTTAKKVLSNIEWGSGIDTTKVSALITELNAIEGITIASGANAAAVAKAIGDAGLENDSAKAQAVADAFNKALSSTTAGAGTIAADATSGTITGLNAGYYLIKDTADVDGEGALTRFMLEVVSNVAVTEKASVPSLTKKVKEKNDTTGEESGWQDAADYDIGDTIPYQITGTLPSKFAEFDTYKTYTITDTLSAGLTAPAASGITVKVGEADVTSHFDITITGEATAVQTIIIALKTGEDLKTWTSPALTKDSTFVVDYTATLNTSAVIGSEGNPNTAKLEFSNNPNYNGDGDTGTTPEDKVIVFTYEIKALKVEPTSDAAIDQTAYNALTDAEKADYVKVGDKWQKTQALSGAGFTLYKKVPAGTEGATDGYLKIGNEITGVTTFEFKGTDAGEYKLVETTVPAGYNKCADITFTVAATYDTVSADPKLKTLTVTPETAGFVVESTSTTTDDVTTTTFSGNITGKVLNQSGTVLPSTGGIGTTIFYVVGSILVVAAGVLLITKKRMSREG